MMIIFDHVKHMMIVKQLTEETTLTISSQCTLTLAPENIRKPYSFLISSGGRQRVHLELMGEALIPVGTIARGSHPHKT